MRADRPRNVVGVRLSPAGRVRFFDPGGTHLEAGDRVTVETEEGPRDGTVAIAPGQVSYSELEGPLRPVLKRLQPE